MHGLDLGALILFAALGAIIVLSGMLSDWLRIAGSEQELALWAFLAHKGVRRQRLAAQIGEQAVRLAELRCSLCLSQQACRKRLRSGAGSPVPDCPNADLLNARAA